MKLSVFIFSLILIISGCTDISHVKKQAQKQDQFSRRVHVTDKTIGLLWGNIDSVSNLDSLSLAISYLNRSEYKEALRLLAGLYPLDTLNVGGFYGFKIANEFSASNYEQYIFFRLNEYTQNINTKELLVQLGRSVVSEDDELNVLQNIENAYLQNIEKKDTFTARNIVNQINQIMPKFSKSKRLKFILANEYLALNDMNSALKLFDNLIDQNYYSLVSLRTVTAYMSKSKHPLLRRYLSVLDEKFISECNIFKIHEMPMNLPGDSLKDICNKCFKSSFQRDSVYSKVLLAKYYLANKQIAKVDSMTNEYLIDIENKTYDSTVLYEKGNYFDLKMNVLFLQEKYGQLCDFAKTKLEMNPIIEINSERDLKAYIQYLYAKYVSSDLKGFETFFNKNFHACY